jgi:gluconate 2-dehydrogenase gamma chain
VKYVMEFSRRDWIIGALGSISWTAVAAAQDYAHQAVRQTTGARFEFFDTSMANEVAAIAAQILPSEDGPGAKEAGVIFFIDRALKTFDSDKQETYRKGLIDLQGIRTKMFPGSASIAALSHEQQFEFIRAIEESDFFEVIRVHTMLGFLGSPSYGGNRGEAGWNYIGFEDRMTWEPPFGYYDAVTK